MGSGPSGAQLMSGWSLLDLVEVPELGTAASHGGLCISATPLLGQMQHPRRAMTNSKRARRRHKPMLCSLIPPWRLALENLAVGCTFTQLRTIKRQGEKPVQHVPAPTTSHQFRPVQPERCRRTMQRLWLSPSKAAGRSLLRHGCVADVLIAAS